MTSGSKSRSFINFLVETSAAQERSLETQARIAFPFIGGRAVEAKTLSDDDAYADYDVSDWRPSEVGEPDLVPVTVAEIQDRVDELTATIAAVSIVELPKLRRVIAALAHPDIHDHLDGAELSSIMGQANAMIDEALRQRNG